ncbi:MAG TPA: transposase [Aggregatilineales bacterium]|nr:transposase [Aggregatilineales bacterium]
MPSRYDDSQKQAAIDQLRANRGDVARTALQLDIPERTLSRWWSAARHQKMANGGEASPPQPPQPPIVPLADAALVTKLRIQQSRMLVINDLLLDAIPQAITVAPLNQQVTALSQMTDRVIKLATELPQPPEEIDYEGYLPPLEQPTPEEAGPAPAASQPTADSAE